MLENLKKIELVRIIDRVLSSEAATSYLHHPLELASSKQSHPSIDRQSRRREFARRSCGIL